jgi:Trp operon repressor
MEKVEMIEKMTQAKYDGEYLYTSFTVQEGDTHIGRYRISKETFKKMLSNRTGWIQGTFTNSSGQTVPYVIRRFEG